MKLSLPFMTAAYLKLVILLNLYSSVLGTYWYQSYEYKDRPPGTNLEVEDAQLLDDINFCYAANGRAADECLKTSKKQREQLANQERAGTLDQRGVNCYHEQMKQTKRCLSVCEEGRSDKDWQCSNAHITHPILLYILPFIYLLKNNYLI